VTKLRHLLDSLRDGHEAEGLAELNEGVEESGSRRGRQLSNEGPIDLQDVSRELSQVGERGVAGAEVVDCDANADVRQGFEALGSHLGIDHQHRLGDFDC
jgi:hypothetical protein